MSARIDLDALERLAEKAAEWMPDLPWERSRHCYQGSMAYIVGEEGATAEHPAGDLSDACDPVTVAALVQAVKALEELYKPAYAEVATKENSDPKRSGVAFWAAQKPHSIPGVQRRIDLARAVLVARAALAPFKETP